MRAGPLLVLLIAGCAKTDDSRPDAGVPPPPDTVTGKEYVECFGTRGMVSLPIDTSDRPIEALLPDPASPSGFRVIRGLGRTDGTFEIAGVPEGMEYMLRLGTRYYVTSQHKVDRHTRRLGRCGTELNAVVIPTPVHVEVSNMQPFLFEPDRVVDGVRIESLAAGSRFYLEVPTGATEISTDVTWHPGEVLPDPGLGDDVWVLHSRTETPTGPSRGVQYLVDALEASGASLREGVPGSVSGAFPPVAPRTATVTLAEEDFRQAPSAAAISALSVSLYALPAARGSAFAAGMELAVLDFAAPSFAPRETSAIPYIDPFPAAWSRVVRFQHQQVRNFRLPERDAEVVSASVSAQEQLFDGRAVTSVPVRVPTEVRIAGLNFRDGGMIPFDGIKPIEVSWSGVATAKVYVVSVSQLVPAGLGPPISRIASFFTTRTSIRIPATVLTGDEFFAFHLDAVQSPADYDAGELGLLGLPSQVGSLVSGMFRLSATCGNNQIDPGETCDTGGQTAACDVDCTAPLCSDGLQNAAAGEACDTGGVSAACDDDCTLPICGDGFVNAGSEACDDGNQVDDGNGCSGDCRLTNP